MSKFTIEKRTTLEIEIYGQTFTVNRPTVSQTDAMLEKLDQATARTAASVWCDFLAELGIDRAFLMDLEADHLSQLIDFITGAKKKSPTGPS